MGGTNSVVTQDNPTMEKLFTAFQKNDSADALVVVQFIKTGVAKFDPNAVFRGSLNWEYSFEPPGILKAILASVGIKINKKWSNDTTIDVENTKPVWVARIFSILDNEYNYAKYEKKSNWNQVFQELVAVSQCNIITDTFCGTSVFSLMHEICITRAKELDDDWGPQRTRNNNDQTRFLPYTPAHKKLVEQIADHEFTQNPIPELITRRSPLVLRDLLETNRSIRKYINQRDYLQDIETTDIKVPYTVLKKGTQAWNGTYESRSAYIEPLLNAGQNNPAYAVALERLNTDSIEFYAKKYTIIDQKGDAILSRLIVAKAPLTTITAICDQAVDRKIDIFTVPYEGSYPLHLACRDVNLLNRVCHRATMALTDGNIVTKLKDKDGRIPLHVLYSVCDVTFPPQSIFFSPELVSQTDNNLDTPLHIACRHLRTKAIKQLTDAIRESKLPIINARNKSGNTPLLELASQKATENGAEVQMELIKLLYYQHNADPTICNNKRESCMTVAFNIGNYDIAKVLSNNRTSDAVAH
jgi:hypothetical protein